MTCNFTWMLMTDVPTYEKKILPIVLPSMVEAENVSDHPRTLNIQESYECKITEPYWTEKENKLRRFQVRHWLRIRLTPILTGAHQWIACYDPQLRTPLNSLTSNLGYRSVWEDDPRLNCWTITTCNHIQVSLAIIFLLWIAKSSVNDKNNGEQKTSLKISKTAASGRSLTYESLGPN